MIRFGCQCQVEEMSALANAGYEFGETDAGVLYPTLGEEAFRRARQDLLAEPLFPEVIRAPGLLTATGGQVGDLSLRELFRRCALVGAKVLVVTTPEPSPQGNGQRDAWWDAVVTLGALGEYAARSGLVLAVQPSGEGTLATTIEEAWVLSEEVGHPAVGVAADLSKVAEGADIAAAGSALKHIWLPLPKRYGGQADTTACLEALGDLVEFGYGGRVTIRADWPAVSAHAGQLLDELKTFTRGA